MKSLSIFTPVRYNDQHQKNFTQHIQEGIEGYFYLGGKSAYIIPGNTLNDSQGVELRYIDQSKVEQLILGALKVASYMTLLIPCIMLIAKIAYRVKYRFHIIQVTPNTPESSKHSKNQTPSDQIKPIAQNFTTDETIATQRSCHEAAKRYLQSQARESGAEVVFVSPNSAHCPNVDAVAIKKDLDKSIFTWENTSGVQLDIQKDSKLPGSVVLYGVASQFNACEATSRFTPVPGSAVSTYESDPTQGPGAQLQFPDQQVEFINDAANIGFNGICNVLDDTTKATIKHGYLTPPTQDSADLLIEQLKTKGNRMEFLCIGNVPKGEGNTERVYEMLVSAPAFGMYSNGTTITPPQQNEIEFLCALHGYRAQFQQVIKLAPDSDKHVVFKPTAPGLGVFGNRVENIAKAFYVAAKEYENELINRNIKVRFQVFKGKGYAKIMTNALGLMLSEK